ncbi:TraB/GumN family protein [Microscilla marina]|uniref:TraB/GumN family protein n=1 Tax=Microscilla marina TaxID=1027 RepID=UPI0005D47DA8|nr:TraB/GumN family protein [Microscilla marina]
MKHTKLFIFSILSVLLSLPTLAQDTLPKAKSIFWEVKGPGVKKPTYLFGTHHLHDYGFINQNKIILDKLKKADIVAGEILIEASNMMKVAMASVMPNKRLNQLMSEKDYKATDECLRKYMGTGVQLFSSFKPIAIYQMIMLKKYAKTLNMNLEKTGNSSMDEYFQRSARNLNKKLIALETVEDQIKVLYDGKPLDKQVDLLLEMVYDKDSLASQEIVKLNRMYKQQDLDGLHKLMQKTASEDELKTLLVERNKKWIPKIEELLKSGKSAFIAVGAGHLPGKSGVLHLLREKGYTISPLKIKL